MGDDVLFYFVRERKRVNLSLYQKIFNYYMILQKN